VEDKIIEIKPILTKKFNLKNRLDEIDNIVKKASYDGYLWSRFNILIGKWEKGKAIDGCFREVKQPPSYRELERQTGRNHPDIKRWYDLYKNNPDRKKYILIAKKQAEIWTERAFEYRLPKHEDWLRIYNIWNLKQSESEEDFFGIFPSIFMENLLYYHTEKNDLIYDPFAGSGTTVDVCIKMNRRFCCSDLVVHPGRKNIEKWNIQNGLPINLEKPDLVFLDPPYWIQAKNKYSKSSDDLANMPLDEFYNAFLKFLGLLANWKIKRIAIVIQPTQYLNKNHDFEDHIFKFNEFLSDKYNIEMRYILPYSTEQYNAQQVEIMKKEKKALNLIRDLVIWKIK